MKTLFGFFPFIMPLAIIVGSYCLGSLFIWVFRPYLAGRARPDTPERHKLKQPALTAGGIYFIAMIAALGIIRLAISFDWHILQLLIALVLFGAIGLLDDIQKLTKRRGISARTKFLLQIAAGFLVIVPFWQDHSLLLPFYGSVQLPYMLGIVWSLFIVIACSNAINLTDGLDGLAASVMIPNLFLLNLLALLCAHNSVALFFIDMAAVLCGFLLLNWFPARLIMGDVGALALGACYGLSFLMFGLEFLIPVAGFVYFFEELSVMIQVFSYRMFKKRIFKMAPFHHHLELSGLNEVTIVSLATALSIIGCVLSYYIFLYTGQRVSPH